MSERAGTALPPSALPRWVTAIQLYVLLIAIFIGTAYATHAVMQNAHHMIFAMAAGVFAFLVAYFGGVRVCLPLYIATTLGETLNYAFLPTSLNRLAAGLLFLAILIDLPSRKNRLHLSLPFILFGVVFQVYYLAVAFVKSPPEAPYPFESFFYIAVFLLIIVRFWEERWMRWLFGAIVWVNLFTMVLPGLAELILRVNIRYDGIGPARSRIDGLSPNAVFFAFIGMWALPFAITMFTVSRNALERFFYGGNALMIVFLSLATLNRQTPILMAAMLVVYVFYLRYSHRRTMIAVMLVAGLLAVPLAGRQLAQRFTTVTVIQKDISLMSRHDKLEVAKEMIHDHLWTGVGHNHYGFLFREYLPTGRLYLLQFLHHRHYYIDFGYIQILTEYGIIGMILFLLIVLASFFYFRKYYRWSLQSDDPWNTNVLATVASLYVMLIVSLFIQDSFITPRTYMMFAIMFAAGIAIDLRRRAEQQATEPHRPQ